MKILAKSDRKICRSTRNQTKKINVGNSYNVLWKTFKKIVKEIFVIYLLGLVCHEGRSVLSLESDFWTINSATYLVRIHP